MNLGLAIQIIRKKKNIAQGDFAKLTTLSQNYLCRIEKGHKTPSLEMLEHITNKLEIPMYYLFLVAVEIDKDIPLPRREAYRQLSPAIIGLIEGLLINTQQSLIDDFVTS